MKLFFTTLFFILVFSNIYSFQTDITVNCDGSPVNTSFCYTSNQLLSYTYTSDTNENLNLIINEGEIEPYYDHLIILDSDGSQLYYGYGDSGNLEGLSFQSSGNQITIQVDPDSSVSCDENSLVPIDLSVFCTTCENFQVNYELISNCDNDENSFSIQVNVTDLGSASELIISDNQETSPISITETGSFIYGNYSNGTLVELAVVNSEDSNCFDNSDVLTQDICLENYLEVTNQYTPNQLVTDFLMSSVCSQTFNITYSTGTSFGQEDYGLGYFTSNGTDFDLEEGIVLTSGDYSNVPGPETGSQGGGSYWPGDEDLENAVPELEQGNSNDATILEFDFVPFGEEMSFNFLFASDEYGFYQCNYSDAFAFLLTDSNGNTQNLAVVPNSNDAVSVVTIRDELYNNGCSSENINYFDKYYGNNSVGQQGEDPLTSPTNFRGILSF
ncbi:choice-of-anchor L domain-containing protein [Mesonia sp.]|uniref:choice-of-anchor L domain-containing protein n=1 Tax=Mesonia sp. TaxID=1960830 RepID=UPI00176EBC16|nr:choice-of-anchor L domain-containing protein [Mesonia sp.]HIB37914.1 hypothetical protein [Mesonia sp.]